MEEEDQDDGQRSHPVEGGESPDGGLRVPTELAGIAHRCRDRHRLMLRLALGVPAASRTRAVSA